MSQIEAARAMVEREVIATQTRNTIILDDGTNEAGIPGFPYRFKAQGDKILVSVDVFKSGYECKDCKGTGRLKSDCICVEKGHAGLEYADREDLTPVQKLMRCKSCSGNYIVKHVDEECKLCKGTGASLFIPDNSKVLPTTGVIVSIGSLVTNPELKNQTRVLFGAYTGVMIPTRAPGIVFKVLRDIEVLCIIKGGEDSAAFDFVNIDKEFA